MRGLVLTAAFLFAALPCAAKVDIVHKENLSDRRPGMHREKFIATFDRCSLFSEYTLEGERTVRKAQGLERIAHASFGGDAFCIHASFHTKGKRNETMKISAARMMISIGRPTRRKSAKW